MACGYCRHRRLKCDNQRPICTNCKRRNKECEYFDLSQGCRAKRKARDFEEYLVAYDRQTEGAISNPNSVDILSSVDTYALYRKRNSNASNSSRDSNADRTPEEPDSPQTPFTYSFADAFLQADEEGSENGPSPRYTQNDELIDRNASGTCLSEAAKLELTELFFHDVYPNFPIIHESRYYASLLHSTPESQPPLCLRYAMWALAGIQHKKWNHLANSCYEKARTYLEQDEMRAAETEVLNVAHVQCWSLIATYESYMLLSLRTWSSIRRAAALAQVLRLHTIDGSDELTTSSLPDAQDYSEVEERRRAFWSAFSNDRWISSRTGYPMTIVEREITTKLPGSERSFISGSSEHTQTLDEAMEMGLDPNTSLFGARAVLACILGRVMQHVGTATSFGRVGSSQQFWTQHKKLDTLINRISITRSVELRPTSSTSDPKLWALEMWLHGLSICLHQTAVDCAIKEKDRVRVAESRRKSRSATDHVIRTTQSVAHLEAKWMDPFTASCVYMAAKVVIQDQASGNGRSTDIDDLRFLQRALEVMEKYWKVTEIFITQFKEDLAKSGINLLMTPGGETPRNASSSSSSSSNQKFEYFTITDRPKPNQSTSKEGVVFPFLKDKSETRRFG